MYRSTCTAIMMALDTLVLCPSSISNEGKLHPHFATCSLFLISYMTWIEHYQIILSLLLLFFLLLHHHLFLQPNTTTIFFYYCKNGKGKLCMSVAGVFSYLQVPAQDLLCPYLFSLIVAKVTLLLTRKTILKRTSHDKRGSQALWLDIRMYII